MLKCVRKNASYHINEFSEIEIQSLPSRSAAICASRIIKRLLPFKQAAADGALSCLFLPAGRKHAMITDSLK